MIGVLGTIIKEMIQGLKDLEIRGQVETIQTIEEIDKSTERHEETCCHSDSSAKPSANADVTNSQMSKL